MTPTVLSLTPYFLGAKDSAFRLETRSRYALAYEASMFDDFIHGRPIGDPTEADWLRPWVDLIAASPATWSRVRLQDEPPTDYQRFAKWANSWIPTEDIRYLARAKARAEGIPDDEDWWIFDDHIVVRLVFDDRDDVARYELVPAGEVARYRTVKDAAVHLAAAEPQRLREAG